MPQYSPTFQVICSDVRKGLSRLNDSSVDTVVTSPPYYGQRDYESDIQIGHEKMVDGKSILSLMMLAAVKGTILTIQANGFDEQETIKAVADLVNDRFGETD